MSVRDKILDFKDFIEYIKNYKSNVEELDNLDRDLENLKIRYASKKKELEELKQVNKMYEERWDDYLETIRDKNKQIRQLKKQIKEMEK